MTDRELMQQALDALDLVTDLTNHDDEVYAAIDALRARLAEHESEPLAQMKEMLEVQGRDGTWNCDTYSQGMYNGMEFMVALAEGRDPVFREAPERWLHTPPQREWQGLTDEEIQQIEMSASSKLSAIYLAEAQLKGKNAL